MDILCVNVIFSWACTSQHTNEREMQKYSKYTWNILLHWTLNGLIIIYCPTLQKVKIFLSKYCNMEDQLTFCEFLLLNSPWCIPFLYNKLFKHLATFCVQIVSRSWAHEWKFYMTEKQSNQLHQDFIRGQISQDICTCQLSHVLVQTKLDYKSEYCLYVNLSTSKKDLLKHYRISSLIVFPSSSIVLILKPVPTTWQRIIKSQIYFIFVVRRGYQWSTFSQQHIQELLLDQNTTTELFVC